MKREINTTMYQEGIFDICEFLVVDLTSFLKEEGRYKYRMINYIRTISDAFLEAHKSQSEEDINIYGRVLYVLERAIKKEYSRMRVKHLSPADALICIILKLINVSESLEGENRFKDLQGKVKEVLTPIYENIRNKAKLDHLWKIENCIRDAVSINKYGTLSRDELDIYGIEHPREQTQEIKGEKKSWGSSKGETIEL